MISRTKHLIEAFFWIFFSKMIPSRNLTALSSLGKFVGILFYLISYKRRRLLRHELKKTLPYLKEFRKTVINSFINFASAEIEQLHYIHLNRSNISSLIEIKGKAYLDSALKKGKGVIAVHPHFGSCLLVLPALGYNGYKVNQIAARGNPPTKLLKKIPGMTRLIRSGIQEKIYRYRLERFEDCLPAEFIPPDSVAALRKVFKKLKKNEIIAIAGTGRVGDNFVPVNLCAREALFTSGPMKMAAQTGAVLLPMFVVKKDKVKHQLCIEKPIEITVNPSKEDLDRAVQEFADLSSRYIESHPDHFAMRLWRMRVEAFIDDHPFFTDYNEN